MPENTPEVRPAKAAYAIYYDKNGKVLKRVDFQAAGKAVTSAVRSDRVMMKR